MNDHPTLSADLTDWAKRLAAFLRLVPVPQQIGGVTVEGRDVLESKSLWAEIAADLMRDAGKWSDYRSKVVVAHWMSPADARFALLPIEWPDEKDLAFAGGLLPWCELHYEAESAVHIATIISASGCRPCVLGVNHDLIANVSAPFGVVVSRSSQERDDVCGEPPFATAVQNTLKPRNRREETLER